MSPLLSVKAELVGKHQIVLRKLKDKVSNGFEVLLPLTLLGDNEENDIILNLHFNERSYVEFRHLNRGIDLVGRDVTFFGFKNPKTKAVERFNVSTVEQLKLEGKMLDMAERQDPSITCHVYRIVKAEQAMSSDEDTCHGFVTLAFDGDQPDCIFTPPVTFTKWSKSRINY